MKILITLYVIIYCLQITRQTTTLQYSTNISYSHKQINTFPGRRDRSLWSLLAPFFTRQTEAKRTVIKHPIIKYGLNYNGTYKQTYGFYVLMANADSNVVCSPVASYLFLGKLALGTEGWYLLDLLRAIGVTYKTELSPHYLTLLKKLEMPSGVNLYIATCIFAPITKMLNDIYKPGIEQINFLNPSEAANEINEMISVATNNMINVIVHPEELPDDVSIVILNTVFFRGNWKKPFQKVVSRIFDTTSGEKKVEMLSREDIYYYYRDKRLKAQFVEVPYQGNVSFVIVLPDNKRGLPAMTKSMRQSPILMNAALKNLEETLVDLSFPKFRIDLRFNLKESLSAIGLQQMFHQTGSGLRGIVKNEEMHVTLAVERVILEIDEKVDNTHTDELPAQTKYYPKAVFTANHPFVYLILAQREQILMGIYNEP